MSSKGGFGIELLAYRCVLEHVEQGEMAISVRVDTEQGSHFTKQTQKMEEFVEWFPPMHTLSCWLLLIHWLGPFKGSQLDSRVSACFAFLMLAASKVSKSV